MHTTWACVNFCGLICTPVSSKASKNGLKPLQVNKVCVSDWVFCWCKTSLAECVISLSPSSHSLPFQKCTQLYQPFQQARSGVWNGWVQAYYSFSSIHNGVPILGCRERLRDYCPLQKTWPKHPNWWLAQTFIVIGDETSKPQGLLISRSNLPVFCVVICTM